MDRNGDRRVLAAAVLGWIGVGGYGAWEIVGKEAGDGWERPYVLFSVSLLLALAATVAATWASTGSTGRRTLRRAGLGLGVLAVASSVMAWAMPLWAALLAITCLVLAVGAPRHIQRGVAVLAGAQVVGIVGDGRRI